jgi:cytochrome c1
MAAGEEITLADIELERGEKHIMQGAETALTICMGCHNLKYLRYRKLLDVGFSREEVDSLRGDHDLNDPLLGANTEEMSLQMFGIVPPDLSLIAKARDGGPRYVYSFLTGFHTTDGGGVDNRIFPGAKMPDILGYANADSDTRQQLQQQAKDVAVFLEWAADPHAGERVRLGYYVIAYLVFLTVLMWLLKRRIWSDVH